MLIDCPECKKQVSDQAETCPLCGFQLKAKAVAAAAKRSDPIWLVAAITALVIVFVGVPPVAAGFLILTAVVTASVSLYKREAGRGLAITILVILGLVFFANYRTISGSDAVTASDAAGEAESPAAVIADWNWSSNPNFAGRGAVIWNVQVKNQSTKNIAAVQVQLTTFDASGKLVTSDDTYVNTIAVGETGTGKGYADYYGTERKAEVRIVNVRYAR